MLIAIAGGVLALGIGLSVWWMQGSEEPGAPEHIASPALPAPPPQPAPVALPPKAEEPVRQVEMPPPDAGAAPAPTTAATVPAGTGTTQAAPRDPGRDRRRDPQPGEASAPNEPNKGSGRSGTITTDDF
jgi:type IV secretory pathway VirB10-like protein